MSDNNDKSITPENDQLTSEAALVEPEAITEAAPPPAAPAAKKTGKSGALIAWFSLLLVLALAAAGAWMLMQAMEREASLKQRISELESATDEEDIDFESLASDLRRSFTQDLNEQNSALQAQTKSLEALQEQLRQQREKLASFSATDHQSWLRAEAQYLLRLANQRLIMAKDVVSAEALLRSADAILLEMNDPGLHRVRAAIAAEQAALRAVPKLDIEGTYLRLSALIEQAGELVIFEMPEQETELKVEDEALDWQNRLERGYEDAARKLSNYIVIRRRDVPMQALMDPQWEGLVRQNLRMLLEQSQVALLSGNQALYRESLQRSQHWVAQFADTDEAAADAMAREIAQLEQLTIEVSLPDITRSLRALDKAVKEQLQVGGQE